MFEDFGRQESGIRKLDAEHASASRGVVRREPSVMFVNDLRRNDEAQPCSFNRPLSDEIRIKDFFNDVLRNSWTVVADGDLGQITLAIKHYFQFFFFLVAHGLHRIFDQIYENLLQLIGIRRKLYFCIRSLDGDGYLLPFQFKMHKPQNVRHGLS